MTKAITTTLPPNCYLLKISQPRVNPHLQVQFSPSHGTNGLTQRYTPYISKNT
jgi:hypothetical protein